MSKRYPGGILRKTPPTPSQSSAQGIWDMASVTQAVKENNWPIAGVPDPISRSLRFRQSAASYLNRTPTTAGNSQKFTMSVWYKPGNIGTSFTNANFLSAGGDGSNILIAGAGAFGSTVENRFLVRENNATYQFYWPMVFRDPAAWYHIVLAVDTTQATSANRAKLYVNGVDQGAFSGTGYAQNVTTSFNTVTAQYIGVFNSSFYHTSCYFAEYTWIDGQQLTASSFGNTNAQTGVWQPIAYTGTYGTNGFYLPFSNVTSTTTIGYDFSGNNNNWTANNISLTTGTSRQSFTTTGTTSWTAPTGVTSVNYLVVAGGGGGAYAGGGGAGGMRTGTLPVVPGVSYTVTVGAGGAGGTGFADNAFKGSDSVFGSITSIGGGAGNLSYASLSAKNSGGSGGAGGIGTTSSGSGTAGQGNAGGAGDANNAGGGGGAGAVGGSASGGFSGNGGAGSASSISGASVTYAGGGGGGCSSNSNTNFGSGGAGGGGSSSTLNGSAGTANTGGGGGGASYNGSSFGNGGAGGSGIVILSWASGATTTYDSMVDVPTQWVPYNTTGDVGALWRGNYATWNSLPAVGSTSKPTYSEGNLTVAFPSFGYAGPLSTLSLPTQNTYCEITCASVGSGGYSGVGIAELFADLSGNVVPTKCVTYGPNGGKTVSGAFSSYGSSFTTGDIIGIAYDYSGNQVTFYKNNVSQGALSLSSLSGALFFCCHATSGAITWTANFGQRPFTYTPPVGFKTLNTTNLPTPTIGATASTLASQNFNAVLYSGNNSTQNIAVGFQPDWVWSKCRNVGRSHRLSDAVRGSTRDLYSDTTDDEENNGSITAFISTGFSLNNATGSTYNTSGETYVSWAWKANGAGVTNTAGSITSTVSANPTAGFSIVTYTGNSTNGATVGHGLLVGGVATAPSMIIIKVRNAVARWVVYQKDVITANNQFLALDTTDGVDTSGTNFWTISSINSTTFGLGTNGDTNGSTLNFVAYCFAPVAGYSAFGTYTGNGDPNGTFVYLGFRPRFIILKRTNPGVADAWIMMDTATQTYNVVGNFLQPSQPDQELYAVICDFLSNGFKLRETYTTINTSGGTYIYMAFAENPFKYALAR